MRERSKKKIEPESFSTIDIFLGDQMVTDFVQGAVAF